MATSLLSGLAHELDLNGGSLRVSLLLTFQGGLGLRRKLGDRKLLPFLRDHESLFHVVVDGGDHRVTLVDGWQCALDRGSGIGDGGASGDGAAKMTGAGAGSEELLEHACKMCDARFASRNQMFKHLRAVHAPPGGPDNTQPRGANGDGGHGSKPLRARPCYGGFFGQHRSRTCWH